MAVSPKLLQALLSKSGMESGSDLAANMIGSVNPNHPFSSMPKRDQLAILDRAIATGADNRPALRKAMEREYKYHRRIKPSGQEPGIPGVSDKARAGYEREADRILADNPEFIEGEQLNLPMPLRNERNVPLDLEELRMNEEFAGMDDDMVAALQDRMSAQNRDDFLANRERPGSVRDVSLDEYNASAQIDDIVDDVMPDTNNVSDTIEDAVDPVQAQRFRDKAKKFGKDFITNKDNRLTWTTLGTIGGYHEGRSRRKPTEEELMYEELEKELSKIR